MAPIESRSYRRFECATFRKTDEKFGGLSNMAPGFPLSVNDVPIWTAEAIYQACRFPYRPDVQQIIINETSPMTAKMRSKPYREETRPDWDLARVPIMRWCLRVKLLQNWEKFRAVLLATGDRPIVEDSRRDDFWGAVATKEDPQVLVGCNVLGRLLMELREIVRDMPSQQWDEIQPAKVPAFLLYGQPIGTATKDAVVIHRTRRPQFGAHRAHR